jgi:hypothetical protein
LIKRNEVSANRYARCGGSGDNANPWTRDELNNQISACNNGTGQNVKCEFYCPQGYHKESISGVDWCYQNSVRKGITELSSTAWGVQVLYNPDCIDAGQETTVTMTAPSADGNGTLTFTGTFRAGTWENAGTRSKISEKVSLTCKPWYWESWVGQNVGENANTNPNGDQEWSNQCRSTDWLIVQPPDCYAPSSTITPSCTPPSGCGTYGSCTDYCSENSNTTHGSVKCQAANGTTVGGSFCQTLKGNRPQTPTKTCRSSCSGYPRNYQGSYGGDCPPPPPPPDTPPDIPNPDCTEGATKGSQNCNNCGTQTTQKCVNGSWTSSLGNCNVTNPADCPVGCPYTLACNTNCQQGDGGSCNGSDGITYYERCKSACTSPQTCENNQCVTPCNYSYTSANCNTDCKWPSGATCIKSGTTYHQSCTSKCVGSQSCVSNQCENKTCTLTSIGGGNMCVHGTYGDSGGSTICPEDCPSSCSEQEEGQTYYCSPRVAHAANFKCTCS